MNPVKKILQQFNGLHYQQEYLCMDIASFKHPLQVYLVADNRVISNVTQQHLFVGYSPLILAFTGIELPENIHLIFAQGQLLPNEIFFKKDAIASLKLSRIKQAAAGASTLSFYEGTNGRHFFQTPLQQLVGSIINRLFNKKPGNVYLHADLYRQVQIAYAVPRGISLITAGDGKQFNLFPTDLHGPIGEDAYVISLRSGGKALEQVTAAAQIVISEVHCNMYKTVYALGKNHMRSLQPAQGLPFGGSLSAVFQWPLPQNIVLYRELLLTGSFTHGIHQLLLFKIIHSGQVMPGASALAHIHNSYASWRYKKGLEGNYLLR